MDEKIKKALIEITGPDGFSDKLIDLVSAGYDYSFINCRPEFVVWPKTTDEVSQILFLANRHQLYITPRGAGTSVAGGPIPLQGGVVMDLCRMNRILEICIPDRLAVVQPGVVYADLDKALKPHGYCFPPDPASSKVCTLGGNVATNAGGLRGAKYGVTRDYILGLQVVLPTGKVIRTGGRCIKSSSGFDLTRLMVGSEGLLGIVTEIIVKLSPSSQKTQTRLAFFPTLDSAGKAVGKIMTSGIIPSVMEMLDSKCLEMVRNKGEMSVPTSQACLLIETDGYTDAEAEYQMVKVDDALNECGAVEIRKPKSQTEAQSLWKLRKSIASLASNLAPNSIGEDITVPISKMPEALKRLGELIDEAGYLFVIYGHAGDGNLHCKIMYDESDPKQASGVHKLVGKVFKLICSLGGTLSGEHGIGVAKAAYMGLEHDQGAIQLMKDIKKLVDPQGILNPGKMGLD